MSDETNKLIDAEIKELLETGKVDRPDQPRGPTIVQPSHGSSIPKAGKRFSGGTAPQGA
jgi:cell division protease FtsH